MGLILVGDIGGTHARLAVAQTDTGAFIGSPATLPCSAYSTLEDLLRTYLTMHALAEAPTEAAVAVAGPVSNGAASFTNLPWRVSEAALRQIGFSSAVVINDFEALALALPRLAPDDTVQIGPALQPAREATLAVFGPGTGFGAAALCRDRRGSAVLVTEGGHIGFAPTDETEVRIWRILTRRFGRVSLERILSGPGLVNLYGALCEIAEAPSAHGDAAEVLAAAGRGDTLASSAVERFCSLLGAAAGDLALAYGAVGGVFLAGGVSPRLLTWLQAGGFRAAFERKGRFADYLAAVPTRVVTHPFLALLGAAEALRWAR